MATLRTTVFLVLVLLHAASGGAMQVELQAWRDDLVPPAFAADDPEQARRTFAPDSLAIGAGDDLSATWLDRFPAIDGRLDDWPPSVRWRDLRGATALVRGTWSGNADVVLEFALAWNADGLLFGARLADDALTDARVAGEDIESVLLSLGTASPVVQRYWRGAERTVRVWVDGRTEAWAAWRNRLPVIVEPARLGIVAGVQTTRVADGSARIETEVFVPWDFLYPALPHPAAQMLVNVLVEDRDAGQGKLFAWASYVDSGRPANGGRKVRERRRGWAGLEWRGDAPADAWVVGTPHATVEAGQPIELLVVSARGAGPEGKLALRVGETALGAAAKPSGAPLFVRVLDPRLPYGLDVGGRRTDVVLGTAAGETWRRLKLRSAPRAADWPAEPAVFPRVGPDPVRFPRAADAAAHAGDVRVAIEALGTWDAERNREIGIPVVRWERWARLESRIELVQAMRAELRSGPPSEDAARTLAATWPERSASGIPIATPVVRGYTSSLDGNVQPYSLYVSRGAARAKKAPLVVVLHGAGESHASPFVVAALAREIEARGWIAVSPHGRGQTGFQLAGERDVLDVVDDARRTLGVDGKRIHVVGYSAGGSAAWLLSLRHPHLFAAAAPISAYGDLDQQGLFSALGYADPELFFFETLNPARLVRPKLDTFYRVEHAERDPIVSVMHARIMTERLGQYDVPHDTHIVDGEQHGAVLFAEQLGAVLETFAGKSRRDAGSAEPRWFAGSGGPIATVFARAPFVVVYGTRPLPAGVQPVSGGRGSGLLLTGPEADRRTSEQFVLEWQAIFAGTPPILPDTLVTAEIEAGYNLVLTGDPRTNRVLERLAPNLPVTWQGDVIRVGGREHASVGAGVMFAAPHPRLPERTVVVLTAMGERLGGKGKTLLKAGVDWVVTTDGHARIAMGHFDTVPSVPRPPRLRTDG